MAVTNAGQIDDEKCNFDTLWHAGLINHQVPLTFLSKNQSHDHPRREGRRIELQYNLANVTKKFKDATLSRPSASFALFR